MASRCKFYVNHRKSERASWYTGGCGHKFPAPGGRCHNSNGIPPALDSEIFIISWVQVGLPGASWDGAEGGYPVLLSSDVLGQLLQALALTLSPPGRSPARPSSSFSSETWGKKAHFHLLINVWGSCVPLSSQRQGWCSEPALIHNQHRPGGQLGRAEDAHTPQGRAVFPQRLGSEGIQPQEKTCSSLPALNTWVRFTHR